LDQEAAVDVLALPVEAEAAAAAEAAERRRAHADGERELLGRVDGLDLRVEVRGGRALELGRQDLTQGVAVGRQPRRGERGRALARYVPQLDAVGTRRS